MARDIGHVWARTPLRVLEEHVTEPRADLAEDREENPAVDTGDPQASIRETLALDVVATRAQSGLSQDRLATAAHTTRGTIRALENKNSRRKFGRELLADICKALEWNENEIWNRLHPPLEKVSVAEPAYKEYMTRLKAIEAIVGPVPGRLDALEDRVMHEIGSMNEQLGTLIAAVTVNDHSPDDDPGTD
jgi:DNA-binding XRE family transcriptional regulator